MELAFIEEIMESDKRVRERNEKILGVEFFFTIKTIIN
jgi:hypothetical protein